MIISSLRLFPSRARWSAVNASSKRLLLTGRTFSSSKPGLRGSPEPHVEVSDLISNETHMKNFGLAMALVGFCGGVAYYSMSSVGQAVTGDDPIAALREEAAQAQDKQDKQEQNAKDSEDMLKKFTAGDFDPDKYEDSDEEAPPKRKPWYKFW